MKCYGKEWYLNGCNSNNAATDEQLAYNEYVKATLPSWYQKLYLHDSYIINVDENKEKRTLSIEFKSPIWKSLNLFICYYEYQIIEPCSVIHSTVVSDEVYINQDTVEHHFMVDTYKNNKVTLEYFTIECKQVEFKFKHKLLARLKGFPFKNMILSAKA